MQVTIWPRGMNRTVLTGPLGIAWGGDSAENVTPVHLTDTGKILRVSYSTRYEQGFGGHDLLEVDVEPLGGYLGGLFRPGDHVRVTDGGAVVYEGEYSEATPKGPNEITLKARGYGYNLYDYDSVFWEPVEGDDDTYYPTNRLAAVSPPVEPEDEHYGWEYAVYQLGMPITQVVGSFPTTAWGESEMAEKPVKVGEVLTALLLESGKRWAVWGRTLVIDEDPTTASYAFDAPEGVFGVAVGEYATHVGVWYVADGPSLWSSATSYSLGEVVEFDARWWKSLQNSNTNHLPTEESSAWWEQTPVLRAPSDFAIEWAVDDLGITRFDARTVVVDYRGAGRMTSGRAGTIAQNLLEQVRGKFVLTGSIGLSRESGFAEVDGGPAILSAVRAGQGMRLSNVRTSQGNLLPDGDFAVIGKTEYTWTAPEGAGGPAVESLTITPMGAVPTNFSEVLKGVPLDAGERLGGAE